MTSHISYRGKLLIAMPGLSGTPFDHSVIFLCQHDEDHAMGLVINHPMNTLDLGRMLAELDIDVDRTAPGVADLLSRKVLRGGPVETGRGFVLHSLDYKREGVTEECSGVGLTASRDILNDMASGKGPRHSVVALGYAGWGEGQLEDELGQNAWLTASAQHDLIFCGDADQLWQRALASLGVAPEHLSSIAGNA